MEGPKFEDTKRSAVICQACTEFSSRHEKLNFKCVSAGLFVFLKSLSFACKHFSIFTEDTAFALNKF